MNAWKLYNLPFDIFQCLSDHVSVIDWELVTVQWFQPLWSGYRLIANTHTELLWYSLNAHRQTHTHRYTYSFRGKFVPSLLISNERDKKQQYFLLIAFLLKKKSSISVTFRNMVLKWLGWNIYACMKFWIKASSEWISDNLWPVHILNLSTFAYVEWPWKNSIHRCLKVIRLIIEYDMWVRKLLFLLHILVDRNMTKLFSRDYRVLILPKS